MQTASYVFHCQFPAPAALPEFKGSTLRGAFGHALKSVVCALRRQQCERCLLAATCGYAFIFEVAKVRPESSDEKSRIAARPHPFVLVPPLTPQQSYAAGEAFDFTLTLFGRANNYLPHIVYAVERMGQGGLGKGGREGQGCFHLRAISSSGVTVYDGERKVIETDRPPTQLQLADPPSRPVLTLTIHLLTPLRLKHHNHLQAELPFHLLIRAALRRISTLTEAYGNGEPDLDYRGLVRRAEAVTIRHSNCRWVDLRRYSNRQKSGMLMGGVLGSVTYEGELTEFLSLLRFCEQVNLGKQTAFGLGRIEVVAGENEKLPYS